MIDIPTKIQTPKKQADSNTTKSELIESLSHGVKLPITMKSITEKDIEFIDNLIIPHLEKKGKHTARELMKNIIDYQDPDHTDKSEMYITPNSDHYEMVFSNYVKTNAEQIATLSEKMDIANSFSMDELKQARRATLNNWEFNEKWGAWLGFITIASQVKKLYPEAIEENWARDLEIFNYNFSGTDIDWVSKFTLKINVPFEDRKKKKKE